MQPLILLLLLLLLLGVIVLSLGCSYRTDRSKSFQNLHTAMLKIAHACTHLTERKFS